MANDIAYWLIINSIQVFWYTTGVCTGILLASLTIKWSVNGQIKKSRDRGESFETTSEENVEEDRGSGRQVTDQTQEEEVAYDTPSHTMAGHHGT